MVRARVLVLALVLACKGVPEPPSEQRTEIASPPPLAMKTLRGEWFEVQIPESWVDLPATNPGQAAAVEAAWSAPLGGNGATLLVGRPTVFGHDLKAYANTQLASLTQLGFVKAAERSSTLGGAPALVADFSGAAASRWWLYEREGLAGWFNCTGRKQSQELPRECDAIATSFRFTAPLPQAPQPVPAADGSKRVDIAGFRLEMPSGWQSVRTTTPKIVWMLRSEAGHAINMTREPHTGGLAAYDALSKGDERAAGVQELARRKARLLGVPALEIDLQFPLSYGGHRSVVIEAVKQAEAFTLTCSSLPAEIEAARATCRRLAKTLDLVPKSP